MADKIPKYALVKIQPTTGTDNSKTLSDSIQSIPKPTTPTPTTEEVNKKKRQQAPATDFPDPSTSENATNVSLSALRPDHSASSSVKLLTTTNLVQDSEDNGATSWMNSSQPLDDDFNDFDLPPSPQQVVISNNPPGLESLKDWSKIQKMTTNDKLSYTLWLLANKPVPASQKPMELPKKGDEIVGQCVVTSLMIQKAMAAKLRANNNHTAGAIALLKEITAPAFGGIQNLTGRSRSGRSKGSGKRAITDNVLDPTVVDAIFTCCEKHFQKASMTELATAFDKHVSGLKVALNVADSATKKPAKGTTSLRPPSPSPSKPAPYSRSSSPQESSSSSSSSSSSRKGKELAQMLTATLKKLQQKKK